MVSLPGQLASAIASSSSATQASPYGCHFSHFRAPAGEVSEVTSQPNSPSADLNSTSVMMDCILQQQFMASESSNWGPPDTALLKRRKLCSSDANFLPLELSRSSNSLDLASLSEESVT